MNPSHPIMVRFLRLVDRSDKDACWRWRGATVRNRRGQRYGKFKLDGRSVLAHRFAADLTVHLIPRKRQRVVRRKQVMHTCDNPLCVNPRHLFVGSQSDNMRDARDKGRLHTYRVGGYFARRP